MRRPVRLARRALLGVAGTLVVSFGTCAQAEYSVQVELKVRAPAATSTWGARSKAIREELTSRFADHLGERFGYWDFAPGEGADAPVRLRFSLARGPRGNTVLTFDFLLSRDKLEGSTVPATWLAAGDVATVGPPEPEAAKQQIAEVHLALIEAHEERLRALLREHVPLGFGASCCGRADDSVDIVLALPWEKFDRLRRSHFRLLCEEPASGYTDLIVKGKGRSARFRDDHAGTEFDALAGAAVEHRLENGSSVAVTPEYAETLRELELQFVFLDEVVPITTFRRPPRRPR